MAHAVVDFELEVELKNGQETKYKLKRRGETVKAKIRREQDGELVRVSDDAATDEVLRLISLLNLTDDLTADQVLDRAFSALSVASDEVEHLEIELTFDDGKELEVEI